MTRGHLMDRATTTLAAGGVTMPAWLPDLDRASAVAAQLVPILSAAWLVLQIVRFFVRWRRGDAA